MRTSTSGLLLILLGVVVLSGFLTGNLDRWLSYLFDPSRPRLTVGGPPASSSSGGGTPGAGERRQGSVA